MLVSKKSFIGAQCQIFPNTNLSSYKGYENLYVSFSPKPEHEHFDDYGVPLEDVFQHMTGVRDVVHYMTHLHPQGWYIHSAKLVTLPL